MTTNLKFANWAKSSLATNFPIASTSLVLKTGDGSKFPATGDFYLVLRGGANQTSNEIVKATARSGDTLTVVRAQDGTVAQDFYANDSVSLTIVRALLSDQTVNTSDTPAFKGLQLNTDPQFADHVEGRIYWDNQDKTAVVDMSISGVKLQLGQENFIRVKNISGATISNGQVVYINGSSSNRPTIALAQSNSYVTSKTVIGVATHNITNGSEGYITTSGLVRDFNTSGFTDGDILYLSQSSPGSLTNVAPSAPNFNVVIGYCEKSHATLGTILVQVQNNSFVQNYFEPTITILPVSRGGTGASTAALAGANILGIGAPSTGKYLTNDGTNYVWADISGGIGVQSIGINNTNGGLVITNSPITSTGTITVNLKDDLLALENLSTIGYAQRIGTSLWQTVAQIPIGDINGTGTLQITNNSNTTAALTITQTGTANALLIEDQAADTTPFVINASGQVIVGHTASAPVGASWPMQVIGTNGSNGLGITQFSADANGGNVSFTKSRNAVGAWGTAAVSGDIIGMLMFYMDKGDGLARGAQMYAQVDGTPSSTSTPGRLLFSTTPDGAISPIERMRINSLGNIGIGGGVSQGDSSFTVKKDMTGSSSTYSIRTFSTIQSDSTSSATAFHSSLATIAAAFTVANVRHFHATQGTVGAGSSISNQYGFVADSSIIGASNNYGFYSAIPAAANRWNFYAGGTADNYFGGNVGIGVTTPDYSLHVRKDQTSSDTWVASHNGTAAGTAGAGFIALQGTAGTNYSYFRQSANSNTYIVNVTATGSILTFTNGTLRTTLDSAGNFGIGGTPSYLLDVFGTAHATSVLADGYGSGASLNSGAAFAVRGNRSGISQYGFLVDTTIINATTSFTAFNCSGVPDSTNADSAVYGYYANYSARPGVNNAVYGASRYSNIVTFQSNGWTSANGWKYGNKFTVTGTTNGLDGTYILLSLTNATNAVLTPTVTTSTSSTTITFSSNVTMTEGCSIYNSAGTYVGTLDRSIYSSTTGTLSANAAVTLTAATGVKYTGYGVMALSVGPDVGYSNGGTMYTASNTFNFFNSGSAPNYFEYDVIVNADINLTGSLRMTGSLLLRGAITNQDGGPLKFYPGTLDGNDNSYVAAGPSAASRGATVYAFGNEHAIYPGKIRFVPGSTAVGDDAIEVVGKATVTLTLTHNGLVLTSGTNVDQVYTTGTVTLASTTWVDVLSGSTLPTGSYYVQVYSASNADMYTGVMSWNSANSTVSSADEIVLHRAGTSSPASVNAIFLQYLRQNAAVPKLQISAAGTRTDTVNIKFRRII